jgi:hypothetical protein
VREEELAALLSACPKLSNAAAADDEEVGCSVVVPFSSMSSKNLPVAAAAVF